MGKFNIYEEEREMEEKLYFKLIKGEYDDIDLAVVNRNGSEIGNSLILNISKKGIMLYTNVNDEINLPLDIFKKIKIRMETNEWRLMNG